MSKHTPGPWRLEMVEDRAIKHLCPVGTDDLSILTVVHQDDTPFAAVYSDADARLIAAAPDLLEALREMTDDMADSFDLDSPSTNPGIKYCIRQARAAIAKATGKTDAQDPGSKT